VRKYFFRFFQVFFPSLL